MMYFETRCRGCGWLAEYQTERLADRAKRSHFHNDNGCECRDIVVEEQTDEPEMKVRASDEDQLEDIAAMIEDKYGAKVTVDD